jgi:hypothetical protein
MSKRIDFAKPRRDQGRSLTSAVRELKATMEPEPIKLASIFEQFWMKRQRGKKKRTSY